MLSLTGISPHSGAGEKVFFFPITSTLDLKVWTRLEEMLFKKKKVGSQCLTI